ncbi:hypothetical protein BDW62DRAFT_194854 [Aspergillus aurantiobrunneus]
MAALRQATILTSMTVNNCAPPNTTPVLVHPITASVDTSQVLSERRDTQTRALVNGLELPPGVTPLPPFVLTLCRYQPTSVCNSFLGYLKVLYHVACQTFHPQYIKLEMYGKLAA